MRNHEAPPTVLSNYLTPTPATITPPPSFKNSHLKRKRHAVLPKRRRTTRRKEFDASIVELVEAW